MNETHGADEIDSDELQDEKALEEGEEGRLSLPQNITLMFVKEVTILLVGVFIGFFWSQYFNEAGEEVHIIVSLLIVILCLVRYIYLFVRR